MDLVKVKENLKKLLEKFPLPEGVTFLTIHPGSAPSTYRATNIWEVLNYEIRDFDTEGKETVIYSVAADRLYKLKWEFRELQEGKYPKLVHWETLEAAGEGWVSFVEQNPEEIDPYWVGEERSQMNTRKVIKVHHVFTQEGEIELEFIDSNTSLPLSEEVKRNVFEKFYHSGRSEVVNPFVQVTHPRSKECVFPAFGIKRLRRIPHTKEFATEAIEFAIHYAGFSPYLFEKYKQGDKEVVLNAALAEVGA